MPEKTSTTTARRGRRPAAVAVAVGLLAAGLVVGLVELLAGLPTPADGGAALAVFALALLFYAAMCGLVAAIAYGRRWALVAYFILFLLSLPSVASSLAERLDQGMAGLAWHATATAVEVIALGLLISRPARAWFAAAEQTAAAAADAPSGDPAPQQRQPWQGRHGPKS